MLLTYSFTYSTWLLQYHRISRLKSDFEKCKRLRDLDTENMYIVHLNSIIYNTKMFEEISIATLFNSGNFREPTN